VTDGDPFNLPIFQPPGSTNALKPLPPLPRRPDQTPARLHALVCMRRISAGTTGFISLDQRLAYLQAISQAACTITTARGWK
jgi:hypothetical protein